MITLDRLEIPRVECPVCNAAVPPGQFCGACGSHMASGSASRQHSFAAHPGEHVLHPSVVSTMFPHLPARQSLPFRTSLAGGIALLVALGVSGLSGPAIATAAFLVPLLYLLYIFDVDVYGDDAVLVMCFTFGLGIVTGVIWAVFTSHDLTAMVIQHAMTGTSIKDDIVFGILLPLGAQVLMLVGAAAAYLWNQYDEVLDGFSAGVAGALGFTLASTMYNLWPELTQGMVSSAPVVNQTLLLLGRGILIPLIAGSATGLIAGAAWLRRSRARSLQAHGWTTSLAAVIPFVAVMWAFLGLVNLLVESLAVVVAIYGAVAFVLVLAVRVALHHMLLAEAVDVRIGPDMVCMHCHHSVPRMAFCGTCGVATRATPKSGTGKLFRAFR